MLSKCRRPQAAGRACRQQEAFEQELERYNIRRAPLGQDRNYRRYWWGVAGQRSHIYVEDDRGRLSFMSTVKEVDELMAALDKRGIRELALHTGLEKVNRHIQASTASAGHPTEQACTRILKTGAVMQSIQLLPVHLAIDKALQAYGSITRMMKRAESKARPASGDAEGRFPKRQRNQASVFSPSKEAARQQKASQASIVSLAHSNVKHHAKCCEACNTETKMEAWALPIPLTNYPHVPNFKLPIAWLFKCTLKRRLLSMCSMLVALLDMQSTKPAANWQGCRRQWRNGECCRQQKAGSSGPGLISMLQRMQRLLWTMKVGISISALNTTGETGCLRCLFLCRAFHASHLKST